jgi:Rne/Rng family ribonuclease
MSKEMVISANPHETRVAIMEEGQLCEFYVEREKEFALVGSIYKGRVTRVLPGMQSAFVDIGLDGDAFLYVSDFLEDIEEFDHIVTAEDKGQKMENQGGQAFAANTGALPARLHSEIESGYAPSASADESMGPPASGAPENAEAVSAPPPITSPAPRYNAPSQDRGRFDNRSRGGGRDFGRRGGRFGRQGGGRGRGSRSSGGDRRYGRELPPSKYASPRSFESQPGNSGPVDPSAPTILPGESLAKYRDRAPSAARGSAPPLEAIPHAESQPIGIEGAAPTTESVSEAVPSSPFRPDFGSSSSHGFEPLPGESISKWKARESAPEHHDEVATTEAAGTTEETRAVTDFHANGSVAEIEEVRSEEVDTQNLHEHAATDLTEEEATAIAEHIADAQVEEAARAAQARSFAADEVDGAVADEAEEHVSGDSDAEEEIESEEAETESEPAGMMARSDETVHSEESVHIDATDREPTSAVSENGSSVASEGVQPPESQPWKAQVRSDFRSRMQHPGRRGGRDRGDRGGRGDRDRGDRGHRDDQGRRPHHGHGHFRPQPRTQLISDMLKQGQEIIVQIAKEPLGKKGARITSHVALPGRFLVYMPTLDHTGVSRKISSAEDRSRLRHLVNDAKGSAGGGFIVRTAAASAAPDEVRADVEFLTRTWADIKSGSEQRRSPALLHRDLNLVERILRDYLSSDYAAIWVDTEEGFTKVVDFVSRFQPTLANRVKLYTKDTPIFEEFGIQQEIDKGLRPKVWLKSGGYIVINHTEALVAIDVNTGKFVGKGSTRLEDTIVRTNLEAVKEIVRQMRLRDLGGIIVIDFIDMEERRNREKVMAALEDALRADRAPSKVLRFNEFGLVAITRKRTKQALERTLCQPCPYCTGSGMVKSIPTLCYEIQAEGRKMAPDMDSGSLTLRVHPEIAKALKTREAGLIEELERWTKKSVIIQADPTLHWEQYDIY